MYSKEYILRYIVIILRIPRSLRPLRQQNRIRILLHKEDILMSHTEFANEIDSRLGCECHAGLEDGPDVAFVHVGAFMG